MDKAGVSKLATANFLETASKTNAKLIDQLIDCDTTQEAYTIAKAAGFTASLDVFKSDIQNIQNSAKDLTGSVLSQVASCGGSDMWA